MIIEFNGKKPKIGDGVFIAETATVIGDVTIGNLSSVWYSGVVRGDMHYIRIGERTNVQDGAILHVTEGRFPLEIGSDVTIGHGAVVHGCTIEDGCLIGMNATILDGSTVGAGSVIAAGALVREGQVVPPNRLVAGIPAKEIREITADESRMVLGGAEEYVKYGALFSSSRKTL